MANSGGEQQKNESFKFTKEIWLCMYRRDCLQSFWGRCKEKRIQPRGL